jgi:dihydroorotate dehydrogenase (NAD+) catalytic subunit
MFTNSDTLPSRESVLRVPRKKRLPMTQQYDTQQTWRWNLEHAPPSLAAVADLTAVPGNWSWCGIPVNSPLGIPAGPLLDSRWLLHSANLGFDILVYKTVRSTARECYPLPNLVPVLTGSLSAAGEKLPASEQMHGSWAVSFGMPSQSPDVWKKDVQFAREQLADGKVLVVSVVGTQDESVRNPDASLQQLADDFALCAKWVVDNGAHGVEANFSCPNVSTSDGQLYQQPQAAGIVAERIRDSIGDAPLVLKIGRLATAADAAELQNHVAPFVNGLAMTNSIPAKVIAESGQLMFDGQPRGICGDATRAASIDQTSMCRQTLADSGHELDLIGVGGISTADHVREYLGAGATSVALATAAMVNPDVGLQIRSQL